MINGLVQLSQLPFVACCLAGLIPFVFVGFALRSRRRAAPGGRRGGGFASAPETPVYTELGLGASGRLGMRVTGDPDSESGAAVSARRRRR